MPTLDEVNADGNDRELALRSRETLVERTGSRVPASLMRTFGKAISRGTLLLPACQDLHLRDPREDDPGFQSGVMARQGIVVASFGSYMWAVIPTTCLHLWMAAIVCHTARKALILVRNRGTFN
ncbi:hypothetical protein M436DRAFT_60595 [Aureobasidium namibiae CBS 147.97]|uniref:Uncharacterized protein n=1 Tax=Aureobasidium namibiae CBS 147.97 TaxID=1043004 RepID=A0A074XQ98_9PEZI